ncbi:MAG: hypothetical protein HC822_23305 [Oscillochloris sp.]|nr:hypothetical protein [Oscillochloris sp.]
MSNTYDDELLAWRQMLDERLRAEDGWLTLIGLHWLPEGTSTIGSDPACTVVLPADAAPPLVATLIRNGDQVFIKPAAGAEVRVNDGPIPDRPLFSDQEDEPDLVQIGRIALLVLARGERLGVRLRDPQNPARHHFSGRRWFPIDPRFRLQATFIAFDQPRTISYEDILGDRTRM